MRTSRFLALAVCFVYAMQICTCATIAKPDLVFAFDQNCLDEHIGICKEDVETSLAAVRSLHYATLKTIVEECGTAETKKCLTFNGGIKLTGKCPDFFKNIEQEIRQRVDADEPCPNR